jgi:HK97 family phage major capsid protein
MQVKEKELRDQLEGKLKSARAIAAAAEKENRDFTDDERNKVKGYLDEATGLKGQLKPYTESAELKSLLGEFGPASADTETVEGGVSTDTIHATMKSTLGTEFVNAPEFKSWLKQIAPNGVIPNSVKGIQSPPLHFGGLKDIDRNRARVKALITGVSDTSAGALVQALMLGLQDAGTYARPLVIRDVVTTGTTTSDSVEFVRVTTTTNNAAIVPEATIAGAIPDPDTENTAGLKPESAIALEKVTTPVKTIAHWIPATKRAISDAGQVRTLIDEFLNYGLEEELEDQMVNGDGNGENFDGIVSTSGVQTHAKGADSVIVAARKARRKVRTVGRAIPNAYLFHPENWEEVDLAVDNEQRYYFGGPMQMGTPRLWGLPVIESEAVPEGTAYVGNFKTCVLWDREQASVSVSDSHADFFVRNLVAILAELRAAFGIFRPSAIVKITGI